MTDKEKEHRARTSHEARRISTSGTFFERLRRHLLTGMLVIIPAFIAAYAVIFIMNAAEAIFGGLVLWAFGLNEQSDQANRFYFEITTKLLSFVMACVVVVTVGYLSTFFLVRRAIVWGETLVGRVPLIKFFYNTPKEVLNTFTASRRNSLKRVVMLEYPRKGIWAMGFATGEVIRRPDNQRLVAVFMPTTPNPTSGFLMYVAENEVYDTNIPVEQGARMIISGGILGPPEICTQKFRGMDVTPNLPPVAPFVVDDSLPIEPFAPQAAKDVHEPVAGKTSGE